VDVDLGERQLIQYVNVTFLPLFETSSCTPMGVGIAETRDVTPTPCVFEGINWHCPAIFGRWIIIDTLEQHASCDVKVFATNDPPCGVNGNAFAGRFYAIPEKRSQIIYIDPQPMEFAAFGCTLTECMCNANFTGLNCKYAISGYRFTGQRLCGEDTLPPRGHLGKSGCECDAISARGSLAAGQVTAKFTGTACQCAIINDQLCAGSGTCIDPNFPYGRCSKDIDDEHNDPLFRPFARVVAPSQETPRFILTAPSVFVINGISWMFPNGQEIAISSVTSSFSTCSMTRQFPVDIAFSCVKVALALPWPCAVSLTLRN
jgi:hypothetical protein